MKGKCMQMKGRWKDMNAHWNENEGKLRDMNTNERNMKGEWKENDRKWMQNERNMKCCRNTWNQQNNSSIHFRACLGMDFGFMLDLEYADFHKSLQSDRPTPKAVATTIATTHI